MAAPVSFLSRRKQMKFSCATILWIVCALSMRLGAAELFLSPQVQEFLASYSKADMPKSASLAASGTIPAAPSIARPVIYRVRKAAFSRNQLRSLWSTANPQAAGPVQCSQGDGTVLKNAPGTVRAGYSQKRGSYFFFNTSLELKPLSRTDPATLESLKDNARKLLAAVLPDEADDFVFANTETDWVMTKAGAEPVIAKQTLRYTRKLNNRHIVDNTAYFSATYSGDRELCALEYVNPHFDPQPCEALVRPAATGERLAAWARGKTTAASANGGAVTVQSIAAVKAMETYRAVTEGTETYLVPHVSFWSKFDLANGGSYERFIDLCQDANRTQNLDRSMIESPGR
jgi:hypothetical protein